METEGSPDVTGAEGADTSVEGADSQESTVESGGQVETPRNGKSVRRGGGNPLFGKFRADLRSMGERIASQDSTLAEIRELLKGGSRQKQEEDVNIFSDPDKYLDARLSEREKKLVEKMEKRFQNTLRRMEAQKWLLSQEGIQGAENEVDEQFERDPRLNELLENYPDLAAELAYARHTRGRRTVDQNKKKQAGGVRSGAATRSGADGSGLDQFKMALESDDINEYAKHRDKILAAVRKGEG